MQTSAVLSSSRLCIFCPSFTTNNKVPGKAMAEAGARQSKRRKLDSPSSSRIVSFTDSDQLHRLFQFSKSSPSPEVQRGMSTKPTRDQLSRHHILTERQRFKPSRNFCMAFRKTPIPTKAGVDNCTSCKSIVRSSHQPLTTKSTFRTFSPPGPTPVNRMMKLS